MTSTMDETWSIATNDSSASGGPSALVSSDSAGSTTANALAGLVPATANTGHLPVEQLNLDLANVTERALSGFRLQRLEVYNWGTFHGRVWSLNLDGNNSLLTGDIGSGKSTLVDAVTTLLVPSQRVAYNKAAGAESKERTLRSYVLGYFKTERHEDSGAARAVALRDHNSYSVILGVFRNEGYDQTVSLAQVFYMKDLVGQPARFFVTAENPLSIARDFSHFGSDVVRLRKRLKENDAEIFDSFPPYGAWFRRRFGIEHEQALELFHQTVSMKSVGNLTEFVRSHMLEPFDVAARLQALVAHFDDLNSAHAAVLKAARQVELLEPLVADCTKRAQVNARGEEMRRCREALKPYFAGLKSELLEKRIALIEDELRRQEGHIRRLDELLKSKHAEAAKLKESIAENGGDRIERLAAEIRQHETELSKRRQKADRYSELVKILDLVPADDPETFLEQIKDFARQLEQAAQEEARLQNELTEATVTMRQSKLDHDELSTEIKSLNSRRSNIPSAQVAMRDSLCQALNIKEENMPFAGELLQIRDEERDWEGAAERVLRNFGLSLLVPDEHYAQVSEWVDRTHLKGRLVYFRVRGAARSDVQPSHQNSLANKLDIKPDSPFYGWLEREVAHRFDIACCDNQEQFRRETRAMTRAGQVKMPGERHEKDDRHRIDDRSRYVLGWTNVAKIAALEGKARQLEMQMRELGGRISTMQKEQGSLRERLGALSKLEEYSDFREMDWHSVATEIARLQDEKQQLESASDVLKTLAEQLSATESEIADSATQLEQHKDRRSKSEQKLSDAKEMLEETQVLIKDAPDEFHVTHVDLLESMRAEALGGRQLTVESCTNSEHDMRVWLQGRIDSEARKLRDLDDRIIKAMTEYKQSYPLETQEVDVSIDSGDEFARMLDTLQADDLPRFQARFKELLNENTIREVANFQSQLAMEKEKIKERIARINDSLTKIDYNTGRYIVLEAQPAQDADTRDFQMQLRACTEGTFTGSDDEQYSEEKFLQVKAIIERFRGREGQTEHDRRWTARVTDVRNWFTFAASERWREDDSEHEHYSDSGGKSGGQKEKLAYTILAASLAYQFKLEWGSARSKSFRFVVIDEAFGRGSDDSAQYGLRLFEQLNLQLLVVTPLQKIDIIEPFVHSVGFVQNDGGNASKLRNLSIEEYQAEKARLIR